MRYRLGTEQAAYPDLSKNTAAMRVGPKQQAEAAQENSWYIEGGGQRGTGSLASKTWPSPESDTCARYGSQAAVMAGSRNAPEALPISSLR